MSTPRMTEYVVAAPRIRSLSSRFRGDPDIWGDVR
jgi:hypothetical protein